MAYVTLSASLRTSQLHEFQRVLLTHVRANRELSRSEGNENGVPYLDDACDKFGILFQKQGYFKEAEALEIEVLDARSRILGVEHPDTIRAMSNLAVTYQYSGKYTEAEKPEMQVLDARNRILAVEHLDSIRAMANLATTYYYLGKYTQAEKLEMQVLDARNRVLGVKHPDTIMAMANLAGTYRNLGKYTEAEKLEIQVLDARNRILGVEHPDTINAMENLAATYQNLGKYTQAEKLEMQVLDARNRILGVEHPDTINAMANLAATHRILGKYTEAEKLEIQVLDSRINIPRPEHPDAMANDVETKLLQVTLADKLQVQGLDAGKEVVETKHLDVTGAMTNPVPNSKQLVLVAKTALQHLQKCDAEIKATLSLSQISQMDYILLAGFNESVIHAGIGYLEEIHLILKTEFPPDDALLSSLGRIFSPFPGMIFTTCPLYCFRTPVFNSEGKAQEWDEVVFTQAHTYTTLQMGHTLKEMELMSVNIGPNEEKVLSGSGSAGGGDGNEKKQGKNIPQGRRVDDDPQRDGEKDSEGDDNDKEDDPDDNDKEDAPDDNDKGDDPDNPDSRGSSGTNLPEIFFNIQTEIYPYAPPVLASQPPSSKPSKYFQLLQLEGSITVQVGFP